MICLYIIKKLLKDKRGIGYPLVAAIVLSLLMLMMMGYEYMRLQIIASGVEKAVQSAVITVANENYNYAYTGMRDGYSGGYALTGETWLPSLTTGDIYSELDRLLGTYPSGGKHIKMAGNALEFEVYGLTVDILNAPFTPKTSEQDEALAVSSSITIEVPVWFMGVQMNTMKADLVIATNLVAKF